MIRKTRPHNLGDQRSKADRIYLACLLATWILSGALYLTLPPSPDQFELDYMGWRLLAGDAPYRDFLARDWPGGMVLHAVSTALFGNRLWSWHALDFLLTAGSTWFIYDLLRRIADKPAASFFAIAYPLLYVTLPQWFAGQHDMTAAQFAIVAVWCHIRSYDSTNRRWAWVAGVLLGFAMLNKPTIGVAGALFALQALVTGVGWRKVATHTTMTAAGALAALLVGFSVPFLAGASLTEIINCVYTYNIGVQFSHQDNSPWIKRSLIDTHLRWWPLFTVAALPAALWGLRRPQRTLATTAFLGLWISGLLSFLIQQKGYIYHLGICLPPLLGLAFTSLGLAQKAIVTKRGLTAGRGLGVVVALILSGILATKISHAYSGLSAAITHGDWDSYWSRYTAGDDMTFSKSIVLSRTIERAVPPDGTVLVVGTNSSINFLSRRAEPTRFFYAPVLIDAQPPLPMAERWLELWEQDLRAMESPLCVVSLTLHDGWLKGNSRAARALQQSLTRHYQPTEPTSPDTNVRIYRRYK